MNKKLLQFASMLLVAVCLCVNFTACDDEDEKEERKEQRDNGGNNDKDDAPVDIFQKSGTENGYAYVDLGLHSGLKWGTCNVGAANPWEYGDYFAWGETTPKSVYNWSTYLDGNITDEGDCGTDKDLFRGITDIKGTQYDAAHVNMGGSWRMPTTAEQRELIANCYWEWTDSYNGKGVAGYIVYKVKDIADKGKAKLEDYYDYGNLGIYALDEDGDIWGDDDYKTTLVASYSLSDTHIFLPAAGYRYESGLNDAGDYGNGDYWSSSLDTDRPYDAYHLGFDSGNVYWDGHYRYYGLSVRGVCE